MRAIISSYAKKVSGLHLRGRLKTAASIVTRRRRAGPVVIDAQDLSENRMLWSRLIAFFAEIAHK